MLVVARRKLLRLNFLPSGSDRRLVLCVYRVVRCDEAAVDRIVESPS